MALENTVHGTGKPAYGPRESAYGRGIPADGRHRGQVPTMGVAGCGFVPGPWLPAYIYIYPYTHVNLCMYV